MWAYISMTTAGRARLIAASDLSRAYSLTHPAKASTLLSEHCLRVPAVGPPSSERTRMLLYMENCTMQYRYRMTVPSDLERMPASPEPFGSLAPRSRDERVVCAYLTRISDQIGQVGLSASSGLSFSRSLNTLSTLVSSPLPSAALSSNESTDGLVGLITLLNKHFWAPRIH